MNNKYEKLATDEDKRGFLINMGSQVTALSISLDQLMGQGFIGTEMERSAMTAQGGRIMTKIAMALYGQLCAEWGLNPEELSDEVAQKTLEQMLSAKQDASLMSEEPSSLQ